MMDLDTLEKTMDNMGTFEAPMQEMS